MKSKMICIGLVLLLITGCSSRPIACDLADGKVCFDSEAQQFKIEAEAALLLSVPNQAYGKAMVALWNETHPDHVGAVQYVTDPMPSASNFISNGADVVFIQDSEACIVHDQLLAMDPILSKQLKQDHVVKLEKILNEDYLKYLAISQTGFAFIANKTMLASMGVSVVDLNGDGMIDAIDSFEKIMALADSLEQTPIIYKEKTVDTLFPFAFNDTWSFYGFLTASGWNGFTSNDGTKPGFDDESFLKSLEFIQELGKHRWYYGAENKNLNAWKWESVLSEEIAPMGIVADWMYYKEYAEILGSEFVISKFPTYNEKQLTPLSISEGYVIRKTTKFPSAANELMRLIGSQRGFQHFINASNPSGEIVIDPKQKELPTFASPYDEQMAKALFFTVDEPMIALPNSTETRAWSMLNEIEIMSVIQAVFKGDCTPAEGQSKIVEMANQWLAGYNNSNPTK